MRRRQFLLALPLALVAGAAVAAEGKPASGQYVDVAPVALPIVVNNRVINYVFVTARVNLAGSVNAPKLREKEPYFRDALVRAGHRTPFTRSDDYTKIDRAKLSASLMRDAAAIVGPGVVVSVDVVSETPKQSSGLPRPPGRPAR